MVWPPRVSREMQGARAGRSYNHSVEIKKWEPVHEGRRSEARSEARSERLTGSNSWGWGGEVYIKKLKVPEYLATNLFLFVTLQFKYSSVKHLVMKWYGLNQKHTSLKRIATNMCSDHIWWSVTIIYFYILYWHKVFVDIKCMYLFKVHIDINVIYWI